MSTSRPRNRSRSIKRPRRTRDEVQTVRQGLLNLLRADHPMTVRQVFYRAVSSGLIPKTEAAYKNTVIRLLTTMRLDGTVPYGWIADNTRWMRKPTTHAGLESMLEEAARTYRRSVWDDQPAYVEVWLEKDALAGVVYQETHRWDVPLMVTRGYPSLSFVAEAAGAIAGSEKPAHLYYLGDHDPSGLDIPRVVERRLRELAPDAEIHFTRVAVNPEQIELWGLPTRPTKTTDSRLKSFGGGESVEVDAIEPRTLRELVAGCIERHIDRGILANTKRIESLERQSLRDIQLDGWYTPEGGHK